MFNTDLIRTLADAPDTGATMPALFVGHGSPMNAIEDNEFGRAWSEAAQSLPRPKAILCISAHWETMGTQATAMEQPKTIYDFYGFPKPLYAKQYPAPGAPHLARLVRDTVRTTQVAMNFDWGLEFDARMKALIQTGDHDSIIHYQKLGQAARLAVPTNEHYLPLLYVLALQDKRDEVRFFADKVTLGAMSMRSVQIG
jgi:aromatic ring-opening dioxygenase catalytic subunit (LigB family)